jgi:hypothetical protein
MMLGVDDEVAEEILGAMRRVGRWLHDEFRESALVRGCLTTDLDPAVLQASLIRQTPRLTAMMARVLHKAPERDWDLLVEYAVDQMPQLPGTEPSMKELEQLWIDYLDYYKAWQDWALVDEPDEALESDFIVQVFRRPTDGKYAADFVSLLPWPHDRDWTPEPLEIAVEKDIAEVREALSDNYDDDYLGLRCLTPGVEHLEATWLDYLVEEEALPCPVWP